MMPSPTLVNEAIPIYLGWVESSYPDPRTERLVARFGHELAHELVEQIYPILQELYDIQPDWNNHTGMSGSEWAVSHLRETHKSIDDKAAEALFWAYSFWNRGVFFKELEG